MRWFCLLIVALLSSCSCSSKSGNGVVKIGIDPTWSPLSFNELQPYVNGYTDEFLQDVSRYAGVDFEKISANWDALLQGLTEERYEVVLCSVPPYNFNLAKYDFTENFLDLGPVLITPANANYTNLSSMNGELVGVITGDPSVLVVEKYAEVIIRHFTSLTEVLDAVANGEIEAAVVDRLPASNYVQDLYSGKLKIVSTSMNEVGLHALCLKGKEPRLMKIFNTCIEQMKKKKFLEALQKKWFL
jgi:ABC-type amino acid transport substrate-binding protein